MRFLGAISWNIEISNLGATVKGRKGGIYWKTTGHVCLGEWSCGKGGTKSYANQRELIHFKGYQSKTAEPYSLSWVNERQHRWFNLCELLVDFQRMEKWELMPLYELEMRFSYFQKNKMARNKVDSESKKPFSCSNMLASKKKYTFWVLLAIFSFKLNSDQM